MRRLLMLDGIKKKNGHLNTHQLEHGVGKIDFGMETPVIKPH